MQTASHLGQKDQFTGKNELEFLFYPHDLGAIELIALDPMLVTNAEQIVIKDS